MLNALQTIGCEYVMSKLKTINPLIIAGSLGVLLATSLPQLASANDRYSAPPAVKLSSDLASPWLLQLGKDPIDSLRPSAQTQPKPQAMPTRIVYKKKKVKRKRIRASITTVAGTAPKRSKKRGISDRFLPQVVSYKSNQKPGTVIINSNKKYLYLVMANGKARRYGVGVGREGFTWSGVKKITRKAKWPGWTPPKEMIARQKKKGNILPAHMPGGPDNPLGARALYLGSSLYRIHGTTQPWTIGTNVSSGCIRMRNEDVIDFYTRVGVGTKVIVL